MTSLLRSLAGGLVFALILAGMTASSATSSGGAASALGQYIVVLKPGADRAAEIANARSLDGDVLMQYKHALNGFAARLPAAALRAIERRANILFVSVDGELRATACDPSAAQCLPTGVDRIEGDRSSTKAGDGRGSVGVNVAVIDTGIATHPDLNVVGGIDCQSGKGFDDPAGHGTHVAGTIGELTNNSVGVAGMAFNVRIMPVKVIDSLWDDILGSPFQGTDDVVARGVRYAVDNGAKVLNMSIGRSGPPSPLLQEALVYATSHGAFVAIAAGNDFEQGNPTEWPAAYANSIQGVVAVGAIGRDRQRSFFSTTGPYVELAAPGGNQRVGGTTGGILQQTYDFNFTDTFAFGPLRYGPPRFDVFAYQFFQGTSMATPHVSGFAALLMQQGITTPAAVEAAMEQFATDLGPTGKDDQYGYGLINPRASLRGLGLAQ